LLKMEAVKSNGISRGDKLLVMHAFKAICLARHQIHDFEEYKKYEDEVVDDLFKELGITNGRELTTIEAPN